MPHMSIADLVRVRVGVGARVRVRARVRASPRARVRVRVGEHRRPAQHGAQREARISQLELRADPISARCGNGARLGHLAVGGGVVVASEEASADARAQCLGRVADTLRLVEERGEHGDHRHVARVGDEERGTRLDARVEERKAYLQPARLGAAALLSAAREHDVGVEEEVVRHDDRTHAAERRQRRPPLHAGDEHALDHVPYSILLGQRGYLLRVPHIDEEARAHDEDDHANAHLHVPPLRLVQVQQQHRQRRRDDGSHVEGQAREQSECVRRAQ